MFWHLHPRAVRFVGLAILGGMVNVAYLIGITVIIVKLARGAGLWLIGILFLMGLLLVGIYVILVGLYWVPEYIKLSGRPNLLSKMWQYPRVKALQFWRRLNYGYQRPGIYSSLDLTRRQIRLLKIAPGQASDQITCSLHLVELGPNIIQYEALSYTWGTNQSPCYIALNGSPFAITRNLNGALRQLRLNHAPRVIWVDALSIDQNNVSERGQQVLLMREIYSRATKTIIWLGEESSTSNQAMEFLSTAGKQDHPQTWLSGRLESRLHLDISEWQAVISLFRRSYWSRVWIIQETAVARHLEIYCGSLSISWEVAVAAQNAWISFRSNSEEIRRMVNTVNDVLSIEGSPFTPVLTMTGRGPAPLAINRHNVTMAANNNLINLLQENWTALATDHRDKIYALLGLATDCQMPALLINYTASY